MISKSVHCWIFAGALLSLWAGEALWAGSAMAAEPPSVVMRLDHYPGALELPLEQKIRLGDPDIIAWQHKINLKFGQDIRPRSADANHPLISVMRRMLAGLPPEIRRLAARHVVAIYLLEEDFGTGTTDAVQDEQGRWRYSYIALNLTVLERTANEWATWKENSTFTQDPDVQIRMILEEDGEDTVEGALRFIFLHELGHSLGLSLGAHGFWDAETLPAATRDSPFVGMSWYPGEEGKMRSRWEGRFPDLSELHFYGFKDAPLSTASAEPLYRALAMTEFPSLYGATNLFDDFAEAFAIYVHHRLLGKPYRVVVDKKGGGRFTYTSCVVSGSCGEKVAALESLLFTR